MKFIKKIWNALLFVLMGKGAVADKAVDNGLCNFGGQGRDRYGK